MAPHGLELASPAYRTHSPAKLEAACPSRMVAAEPDLCPTPTRAVAGAGGMRRQDIGDLLKRRCDEAVRMYVHHVLRKRYQVRRLTRTQLCSWHDVLRLPPTLCWMPHLIAAAPPALAQHLPNRGRPIYKLCSPGCIPAAAQNPPRTSDPHKLLWKLWRFPDGPANGEPEVKKCSGSTAAMRSCNGYLGWCMQGGRRVGGFAVLQPVAWGLQTTGRCSGLQLPAACRARRCMTRGGRSSLLTPCSQARPVHPPALKTKPSPGRTRPPCPNPRDHFDQLHTPLRQAPTTLRHNSSTHLP